MQDIRVVDTHVHLWDPQLLRYSWHDGNPVLNKPFLIDDFAAASLGIDIDRIIFVQAECSPEQFEKEVKWVADTAKRASVIGGIIAYAPVAKGQAVREELERIAQYPLVKGVRQIIQFEPDIDFCIKPGFIEGVSVLSDFGLIFELCVIHTQLENTLKLVRKLPDIQFVLDHIGKPDIKNGLREPWQTHIRQLAQCENVCCKISGMVNEARHHAWTRQDLEPYVHHVIDCFGIDRVMFGGDWPVILMAGTYRDWFEAYINILSTYTAEEVNKISRQNAYRIYQLSERI